MDTLTRRRRQGFTLIEILVVIAIMMIMMGIAIFGFVDWGRGQGMRASVLNFKGAFSQARQHAITHRVRTQLHYGNVPPPGLPPGLPPPPGVPPWRGYYYVTTNDTGMIGYTNFLPEGVVISNGAPVEATWPFEDTYVEFRLDGSCTRDADEDGLSDWEAGNRRRLFLFEIGRLGSTNRLSNRMMIYRPQGSIKKMDD